MTIRELEPWEWGRLEGHPLFKDTGLPNPDLTKILIAETEAGEIVGLWCMVQVVHIEPIWIAPEHRNGMLLGRMWRKMRVFLDHLRLDVVFCFSQRSDTDNYLTRLKFRELPYRTFIYDPHNKYPKDE
jgi:hypothetical protein